MKTKYGVIIGWLYPDLMSTYGDRGNIICISKRCEWRSIDVEVIRLDIDAGVDDYERIDFFFAGGAQDRQQEIVMRDLASEKGQTLRKKIEDYTPALFVCGAPQLMGKYYEPALGKRIDGLGIFDMVSIHPGLSKPRLIGNIAAEVTANDNKRIVVGFENHGGRTYLGKNSKPFAKVLKGFGNNGEDKTEGIVYKNAIGCYFHGPLLPKNPQIADWLIKKSLEVKYKKKIKLESLEDSLESQAHKAILKRLNIIV